MIHFVLLLYIIALTDSFRTGAFECYLTRESLTGNTTSEKGPALAEQSKPPPIVSNSGRRGLRLLQKIGSGVSGDVFKAEAWVRGEKGWQKKHDLQAVKRIQLDTQKSDACSSEPEIRVWRSALLDKEVRERLSVTCQNWDNCNAAKTSVLRPAVKGMMNLKMRIAASVNCVQEATGQADSYVYLLVPLIPDRATTLKAYLHRRHLTGRPFTQGEILDFSYRLFGVFTFLSETLRIVQGDLHTDNLKLTRQLMYLMDFGAAEFADREGQNRLACQNENVDPPECASSAPPFDAGRVSTWQVSLLILGLFAVGCDSKHVQSALVKPPYPGASISDDSIQEIMRDFAQYPFFYFQEKIAEAADEFDETIGEAIDSRRALLGLDFADTKQGFNVANIDFWATNHCMGKASPHWSWAQPFLNILISKGLHPVQARRDLPSVMYHKLKSIYATTASEKRAAVTWLASQDQ